MIEVTIASTFASLERAAGALRWPMLSRISFIRSAMARGVHGLSMMYCTPRFRNIDEMYSVTNSTSTSMTGFLSSAAAAFSTDMPSACCSIRSTTRNSGFVSRSRLIARTPSVAVPTTTYRSVCLSVAASFSQNSLLPLASKTRYIFSILTPPLLHPPVPSNPPDGNSNLTYTSKFFKKIGVFFTIFL